MTSTPNVFIHPIKDKMRKITFDDLLPVSDMIIGWHCRKSLSLSGLHRHTLDNYITRIKNIPGVDEFVKNEIIADCKKYLLYKEEVDELERFRTYWASGCASGNYKDRINEHNKKIKDASNKLGRLRVIGGGVIDTCYPRTAVTQEEAILLEAALIKFQHDRGLMRWKEQFPYRVIRPPLTEEELAKIVV
jgi:hypothetical protein